MAELYERFVALYPHPHERIRHGAPRAELNRRYLEHLYEGKNRGTTPIVVALDPTLLGTIENNVSLRTSTPVQHITGDTVERYAHELITDQHHYLDQVGVEVAAHEAFRHLNESAYLHTYRRLMENGELGEDDIGRPLKAEYPFELTAGIINEKVKAADIDSAAELLIMDLPLRDVSGVFAYLPFGGWDSSPSPEAMLSIARYWFERDDAYPAVIASDFIEFYTPVPVTTRRDAEILAVEHTMVSSAMPVRVYRGFDKLVEALYGQHDWYLWWEQLPRRRSLLKRPKPA
ncbi:DUF4253 domain-containing protein [Rothia sp. P3C3.S176]|uniref:DUF4253 domain-containing protein n=1 Tax=Rothia sp. P3C3.S176 TaxID=2962204 RepID=UPI0020C8A30B|nr:DUF4253 domain-containing protein [Rothia sp. P3C3.S176]MCP8995469.1 DUF4253 domain-containing protein [Rothia sp. P3C3.S176]